MELPSTCQSFASRSAISPIQENGEQPLRVERSIPIRDPRQDGKMANDQRHEEVQRRAVVRRPRRTPGDETRSVHSSVAGREGRCDRPPKNAQKRLWVAPG